MFADQLTTAIATASLNAIDQLSRTWQGHAIGAIDDDQAQRLAELIQARRQPARAERKPVQDRLPVQDERRQPVAKRGLCDQRVPAGPVVAVAGEEPDPGAVPLDDQTVAVVFNFVDPGLARRYRGSAGR